MPFLAPFGALSAAKEGGDWGIGVDADQFYLGKHILTSALKRVDVAVFLTVGQVKSGKYKGGVDQVFNAKNGAIGFGRVSANAPANLNTKLAAVYARLKAGKITGIPTTVK